MWVFGHVFWKYIGCNSFPKGKVNDQRLRSVYCLLFYCVRCVQKLCCVRWFNSAIYLSVLVTCSQQVRGAVWSHSLVEFAGVKDSKHWRSCDAVSAVLPALTSCCVLTVAARVGFLPWQKVFLPGQWKKPGRGRQKLQHTKLYRNTPVGVINEIF